MQSIRVRTHEYIYTSGGVGVDGGIKHNLLIHVILRLAEITGKSKGNAKKETANSFDTQFHW